MSGVQGNPYVDDSMRYRQRISTSAVKGNDYRVYCPGAFFSMNKDETTVVCAEQNGVALWWPNITSASAAGDAAGFNETYWLPYRSNSSYNNDPPEAFFFGYNMWATGIPLIIACHIRQTYV